MQPGKSLEPRCWAVADPLRENQEPSEYKHVVLDIVFLKYNANLFQGRRPRIKAGPSDPESEDDIPNKALQEQKAVEPVL